MQLLKILCHSEVSLTCCKPFVRPSRKPKHSPESGPRVVVGPGTTPILVSLELEQTFSFAVAVQSTAATEPTAVKSSCT